MESMLPCYSLLDMKVVWVKYLLLINPYKFVSGYLFFNLEEIKDHKDYIISCKVFFQLNLSPS